MKKGALSEGFKAAMTRLFNIRVGEVSMVGGPAIDAHFTEVKAEGKTTEEDAMNEAQIKAMLDAALAPIKSLVDGLGTKIEEAKTALAGMQTELTAAKESGAKSVEAGTKLEALSARVEDLIKEAGERFDAIEEVVSKGKSARLVAEGTEGDEGKGGKEGAKGVTWPSFQKAAGAVQE